MGTSLWPAIEKDPAEIIDRGIDWGATWLPAGDTISTSTWTASTGLTVDSDSHTTTTTTVRISGGTAGESYTLTNHIVTAGGLEGERTLDVDVFDM